MTTEALETVPALDTKTLLSRINARLTLLRAWLSHDHCDEPFWWARKTRAAHAQREREVLRQIANVLHVERATRRGRIHGHAFETLDAQKVWLEREARRGLCEEGGRYAGLRAGATLEELRAGQLPVS